MAVLRANHVMGEIFTHANYRDSCAQRLAEIALDLEDYRRLKTPSFSRT